MARRKRTLVLGGKGGQFESVTMSPATYTTFCFTPSGGSSAKKQTIEQTIHPLETDDNAIKLQAGKKPWTALAKNLKNKWFAAMRKKKEWIPRRDFLSDFLNGREGKRNMWKGLKLGTEDRRFQDNPEQWKPESIALKASFKQATKNRR